MEEEERKTDEDENMISLEEKTETEKEEKNKDMTKREAEGDYRAWFTNPDWSSRLPCYLPATMEPAMSHMAGFMAAGKVWLAHIRPPICTLMYALCNRLLLDTFRDRLVEGPSREEEKQMFLYIMNRPGIAGAVLQSTPSFIN